MAGAVIGALRIDLSIDTAAFKTGLSEANTMAGKFSKAIDSSFKIGFATITAAATAAAGALTLLTKKSFETISAQVDLSRRVGASVAAIQTLQHQTELSGGNVEALAKLLGTLNIRLGEAARTGAGPAYEALQRLGLSAQELSKMDADERIKTLSDRMVELHYSTQQQADTLKSFGVRQQEMLNLFQEGSAAINSARKELADWGVLISDVDAAKVEAAGDAWDRIKSVLEGVGNQIAIRVAPFVEALANYITDAAKQTHGFGDIIDKVIATAIHWWAELNVEVTDFLRSVYMAGDGLTDLINSLGKVPVNVLSKILGEEVPKDWPDVLDNPFKQWLKDLKDPTTEAEILAQINEIRQKAEEAAQKAVDAAKKQTNTGGMDGPSDAEQKELEKFQEKMATRLQTLLESLQTEAEAEQANYELRLNQLERFHDEGMLSDADFRSNLIRNSELHAKKMKEIQDDIAKNQWQNILKQEQGIAQIANDIGSALTGIFGESKIVAIAQAIINTAQAVTKAFAEYGPTPLGFAAAAAAAAAGAVQIATIRSTSPKGGSSGGHGNVGATPPSASNNNSGNSTGTSGAPSLSQTIFIDGINPNQIFTGSAMRALLEQIVDAQRDGAKVVLK